MENFRKVVDSIENREYKVSNGKLNQVERNNTKSELLDALMQDLNFVVVGRCKEGVVLQLPHYKEGSIHVILDAKIKPLEYDGLSIVENYTKMQKEKADRAAARQRDKEASYKNTMLRKEMEGKK